MSYQEIKRLIFSITIIFSLVISGLVGLSFESENAQAVGPTNVSGIISTNTTWTEGNSPYIVTGNVIVENGVRLTIEPGVLIKFESNTELIIDGSLLANGSLNNSILFTSNSSTPAMGNWKGLKFRDSSLDNECMINYGYIKYAVRGIDCVAASPKITNSIISNNSYGIYADQLTNPIIVKNNSIKNNNFGIKFYYLAHSSKPGLIEGNDISYNTNGMETYRGPLIISNNTFVYNNAIALEASNNNIFVTRNNFRNNNVGLKALGDSVISNNTMTLNSYGIRTTDKDAKINYNNIFNNTIFNWDNKETYEHGGNDAEYNWWGTTNTDLINQSIYDYYDDFNLGKVDYIPFLTSPVNISPKIPINNPPIANAGPDQNVTVNQTVNFDGNSSYDPDGDTLSYKWDFGDGTSTNWQNNCNSSHVYNKTGVYTVTLFVTDGAGGWPSVNDNCIVNVLETKINKAPIANAGPDQNVIINQTVNFDGNSSYDPDGDTLSYKWDFGDGTSTNWQYNCNSSHAYNKSGNYTVTLFISDGVGGWPSVNDTCIIQVMEVKYNQPPIANAGTDLNATVNQTVNFDGSKSYDPDNDTLTYKWDFGDGISTGWLNTSKASHKYSASGKFDVTLTVSDGVSNSSDKCIVFILKWITDTNNISVIANRVEKSTYIEIRIYEVTGGTLNLFDAKFDLVDDDGILLFSKTLQDANPSSFKTENSTIYPIPMGTTPIYENSSTGKDKTITSESMEEHHYWKECVFAYIDIESDLKLSKGDKIWCYKDWTRDNSEIVQVDYSFRIINGEDKIILNEKIGRIIDQDKDTDGDLYPDSEDDFPNDPKEWVDSDGDGYGDNGDKFPDDGTQWNDTDGDGYGDNLEGNQHDRFPNDPTEWWDTDGDGIGDNSDYYKYDPDKWLPDDSNNLTDSDEDGLPDVWELEYFKTLFYGPDNDTDGDSLFNLDEYKKGTDPTDKDTDNDGYTDKIDYYPTDSKRHLKGEKENQDTEMPSYIIIIIFIVIVILILLILLSFILRKKQKRINRPFEEDRDIRMIRDRIIQGENMSESNLTDSQLNRMLEKEYKNGKLSDETVDFIMQENIIKKPK